MKKKITFLGTISWVVGMLVSLAVGFGMAVRDPVLGQPILTIPFIPLIITVIAGWIVVIGVIVSLIGAIARVVK
jgi:hypothetical protein